MTPTIPQIKAARAYLGLNQTEFALLAGISQTGLARIETEFHTPTARTVKKMMSVFHDHGISFINGGIIETSKAEEYAIKEQS